MAIETKYLIEKNQIFMHANLLGDTQSSYAIMAVKDDNVLQGIQVVPANRDTHGFYKRSCEKLTAVINNQPLQFSVRLTSKRMCGQDTSIRIVLKSDIDLGQKFKEVLGEGVALQACIKFPGEDHMLVQTQEMKIPAPDVREIVCADVTYHENLDEMLKSALKCQTEDGRYLVQAELSLWIVCRNSSIVSRSEETIRLLNRQILQKAVGADAVILTNDGSEVKCHRSILMAQSYEFQTKFGSETRTVEMPDTIRQAARAFLAFLYHRDDTGPAENCEMALELLRLGHQFKVWSLKEHMKTLLLFKPETWYKAEMALNLYLFVVENMKEEELLKKKSVLALKKNASELWSSATYKQLVKENSGAFKRLFEYSFTI